MSTAMIVQFTYSGVYEYTPHASIKWHTVTAGGRYGPVIYQHIVYTSWGFHRWTLVLQSTETESLINDHYNTAFIQIVPDMSEQ